MAKLSRNSVIFNGAGAVIALIVGGYVIHDLARRDEMPPCSSRYPAATEFALETDGGVPLSAIELQARAGTRERGVLEHASTVRAAGAPASTLLEVALERPQGGGGRGSTDSGVAFGWTPPDLSGAGAACLSYGLWLPDDFPFGAAGTLPGIVGGGESDAPGNGGKRTGFATRVVWRDGGAGEVFVQLPGSSGSQGISVDRGKFALARGRWVRIEQEVVLNTPGKADGILRLWIDGALRTEQMAVQWRTDETSLITGVAAEIGYGMPDRRAAAPQSTALRFTPFELRWQ